MTRTKSPPPAVFLMLLSIILSLATTTVFAFTQTKVTTLAFHGLIDRGSQDRHRVGALHAETGGGGAIKKSYNDDALFNFHMMTQAQKIRDYSAMESYVNTQSLWNLAWHDSFVRNGLSDFVPPLTDTLNVLVVGNRYQGPTGGGEIDVLVETEEEDAKPSTATTSSSSAPIAPAATSKEKSADSTDEVTSLQKSQDSSCSFLAAVFDDNSNILEGDDESNDNSSNDVLDLASYDCIMDQGLIADIISASSSPDGDGNSNKNKQEMTRLLYEATKRIREMGIYVANTPPMSDGTKDYLRNLGQLLGLQWEFDLDGISDDNLTVSVARKFGSCPTIGWQTMARLIEE